MFYRVGITECIEKELRQKIRLNFKSTSSSNLNQTKEMMIKCVAVYDFETTRATQSNVSRVKK